MSTFTNNNVASGDVVLASDHNTQGANIAAVVNGNIEADNIASNAVITAKIADANVTNAKLATTAGELGGAWQTWTPSFSAAGSMTYTSVTTNLARFMRVGKTVHFNIQATGTTGGSASSGLRFTLPSTSLAGTNIPTGAGYGVDSSTIGMFAFLHTATIAEVRKSDSANFGIGASRAINIFGRYEEA